MNEIDLHHRLMDIIDCQEIKMDSIDNTESVNIKITLRKNEKKTFPLG